MANNDGEDSDRDNKAAAVLAAAGDISAVPAEAGRRTPPRPRRPRRAAVRNSCFVRVVLGVLGGVLSFRLLALL